MRNVPKTSRAGPYLLIHNNQIYLPYKFTRAAKPVKMCDNRSVLTTDYVTSSALISNGVKGGSRRLQKRDYKKFERDETPISSNI